MLVEEETRSKRAATCKRLAIYLLFLQAYTSILVLMDDPSHCPTNQKASTCWILFEYLEQLYSSSVCHLLPYKGDIPIADVQFVYLKLWIAGKGKQMKQHCM
jgi:hypothetical protein